MAPLPAKREKRLVGTSLKMYFDLPQTLAYIDAVASLSAVAEQANVDLFVIPDFVTLIPAQTRLSSTTISLGAQDSHWEEAGAWTGEVSTRTLAQAGVTIVELGHAERRRAFAESDADVARKAAAVARQGLVPLVCVGEQAPPPPHGPASQAIRRAVVECEVQVRAALSRVPDGADVILAYEPVWAIGAAEPAGADHVVGVAQALRALVAGRQGRTRILYGGSAGPGTFAKLAQGVDGLFLGRFAHDIKNLDKVIQEMAEPQ